MIALSFLSSDRVHHLSIHFFHLPNASSIPSKLPKPILNQRTNMQKEQFALTEASYVTVRLLQRFDGIVNCDPATETTHGLTLTSCPGNGVKVRLHAAKI